MPTYEVLSRFWKDWESLLREEQRQFQVARRRLVYDLNLGQGFRSSLRIKGVKGHRGVYEMTWAPDGRATFSFGTSPHSGDVHIIWRRVGSHEILDEP
jgi:hypothetical protein